MVVDVLALSMSRQSCTAKTQLCPSRKPRFQAEATLSSQKKSFEKMPSYATTYRLVPASVAVVWSTEDGDNVPVVRPVVALSTEINVKDQGREQVRNVDWTRSDSTPSKPANCQDRYFRSMERNSAPQVAWPGTPLPPLQAGALVILG